MIMRVNEAYTAVVDIWGMDGNLLWIEIRELRQCQRLPLKTKTAIEE
jgi:hypothetical protein